MSDLPKILISQSQFNYLSKYSTKKWINFPITLTCHDEEEIFFTREDVQNMPKVDTEACPDIIDVVDIVLEYDEYGSTFHVTEDAVHLSEKDGFVQIAKIQIISD